MVEATGVNICAWFEGHRSCTASRAMVDAELLLILVKLLDLLADPSYVSVVSGLKI